MTSENNDTTTIETQPDVVAEEAAPTLPDDCVPSDTPSEPEVQHEVVPPKPQYVPYEPTDNFFIQKVYLTNIRQPRYDFFADICRGKKTLHVGCADAMVFNPTTNLHIYLCSIDARDAVAKAAILAEEALKKAQEPLPVENEEPLAEAVEVEAEHAPIEDVATETEVVEEPVAVVEPLPPPPPPEPQTVVDGLDINLEAIQVLASFCPGTYFTSYTDVKDSYDIVLVPEVMEHVPDVGSFLKDIFSVQSHGYFITVPSMGVAQMFCDDSYAIEMVHPDHKYWFSPYTLYKTILPYTEGHHVKMFYLENKSQVGVYIWKKEEEVVPPPPPPTEPEPTSVPEPIVEPESPAVVENSPEQPREVSPREAAVYIGGRPIA